MVKNKVAPPFREAEFDIIFGEGISMVGDVLDLAAANDIIIKSGAWYAYNGNKIGQGRENAKQYLRDNPSVFDEVVKKVRVHYGFDQDSDSAEAKENAIPKAEGADIAKTADQTDVIPRKTSKKSVE